MCDNNVTKTKTEKVSHFACGLFACYATCTVLLQVINVGKCIGTCAGVELPGRCYP